MPENQPAVVREVWDVGFLKSDTLLCQKCHGESELSSTGNRQWKLCSAAEVAAADYNGGREIKFSSRIFRSVKTSRTSHRVIIRSRALLKLEKTSPTKRTGPKPIHYGRYSLVSVSGLVNAKSFQPRDTMASNFSVNNNKAATKGVVPVGRYCSPVFLILCSRYTAGASQDRCV